MKFKKDRDLTLLQGLRLKIEKLRQDKADLEATVEGYRNYNNRLEYKLQATQNRIRETGEVEIKFCQKMGRKRPQDPTP